MVSIVVGRRAAAGAGFASAMLRIGIFTPRTGGVAVISIIGRGISTGTARGRSAMLTGRRIAPCSVAHTVRSVVIVCRAAVPTGTSAPVLTGRILLPASITVTMATGVDRFTLGLPASTAITAIPVAGTGRCLLALQHPCMAAAIRAGARPISTGSVALGSVCA